MKQLILAVILAGSASAQTAVVDIPNTTFPKVRFLLNQNFAALTNSKAPLSHVHLISNITSLQLALDAKAPLAHVHAISDITGLQEALGNSGFDVSGKADTAWVTEQLALKSDTTHNHNGLYAALTHVHLISDITGLETALDAKANVADLSTLTAAKADLAYVDQQLALKSDASHNHDGRYATPADLAGKQALLGFQP